MARFYTISERGFVEELQDGGTQVYEVHESLAGEFQDHLRRNPDDPMAWLGANAVRRAQLWTEGGSLWLTSNDANTRDHGPPVDALYTRRIRPLPEGNGSATPKCDACGEPFSATQPDGSGGYTFIHLDEDQCVAFKAGQADPSRGYHLPMETGCAIGFKVLQVHCDCWMAGIGSCCNCEGAATVTRGE